MKITGGLPEEKAENEHSASQPHGKLRNSRFDGHTSSADRRNRIRFPESVQGLISANPK
jgi:hypothetical protein